MIIYGYNLATAVQFNCTWCLNKRTILRTHLSRNYLNAIFYPIIFLKIETCVDYASVFLYINSMQALKLRQIPKGFAFFKTPCTHHDHMPRHVKAVDTRDMFVG